MNFVSLDKIYIFLLNNGSILLLNSRCRFFFNPSLHYVHISSESNGTSQMHQATTSDWWLLYQVTIINLLIMRRIAWRSSRLHKRFTILNRVRSWLKINVVPTPSLLITDPVLSLAVFDRNVNMTSCRLLKTFVCFKYA